MFSRVAAFAYVYVALAGLAAAVPWNQPTTYTTVSNGHTTTVTSTITEATTVTTPVTTTVTKPVTTTIPVITTQPVPTTSTVTVTAPAPSGTIPASQCNTGDLQCCNSVQSASSNAVSLLLGLLGVVLSDVTGLVGLTCSPLTILGGGGTSCSAQPVCCTDNNFNGLISLGCNPINVNL